MAQRTLSTLKSGAAIVVLTLGTGCSLIPSVGPNYEEPKMELPSGWTSPTPTTTAGDGAANSTIDASLREWWKKFNEPGLEALIGRAVERNHDVRIAADRLAQARAFSMQAASEFLPHIDAKGNLTRGDTAEGIAGSVVNSGPRTTYQAGLGATWNIDVFGGTRRAYEAAGAEVESSEEQYQAALLSLLSEVARSFITHRSLQKRVAIATHNIKIQEESLGLVEARFSAGVASELDVAQARAELEVTRAQYPLLEQALRATAFRIAVLTGDAPGAEVARVLEGGPDSLDDAILKNLPELGDAGLPSDLLRRRPDIRAAERTLAASTARVGEAIAEFFPSFDITAAFGGQSGSSQGVFKSSGRYWSFVPGLRLPLFQGGRILAEVRANRAAAHEALMRYELTVLTSLEETENAFTALQKQHERKDALQRGYMATQRALALSKDLYEQGLVDFLRVIEAERSAYAAEDQLVQSEEQLALNTVRIFVALGGGW